MTGSTICSRTRISGKLPRWPRADGACSQCCLHGRLVPGCTTRVGVRGVSAHAALLICPLNCCTYFPGHRCSIRHPAGTTPPRRSCGATFCGAAPTRGAPSASRAPLSRSRRQSDAHERTLTPTYYFSPNNPWYLTAIHGIPTAKPDKVCARVRQRERRSAPWRAGEWQAAQRPSEHPKCFCMVCGMFWWARSEHYALDWSTNPLRPSVHNLW